MRQHSFQQKSNGRRMSLPINKKSTGSKDLLQLHNFLMHNSPDSKIVFVLFFATSGPLPMANQLTVLQNCPLKFMQLQQILDAVKP